jgi:hypothetical protein
MTRSGVAAGSAGATLYCDYVLTRGATVGPAYFNGK